jgi:SMC interacting uncharacterized protein involved in chromosome segregation
MIRSKAFRRLIDVAKLNPKSPKEIAEKFNMSLAAAYDYWNCLKTLKEVFTKNIDEEIEKIKRELEALRLDLKSKELEEKIIKLRQGLDEILEERRKRLGY